MGSPVHRASMGDTWSRQVHPDIESERHMQSFNVEELTNILDGGAQNTALRRKVESIIHSDPELSLKDNYFMTQNERYEAAIKKKFHIQMLAQRLGWSEDSRELHYAIRSLSGDLGLALQFVFQKALRSLGSEEQIAKWDPLCNKLQILATYAQTELGHGTYLQGLETEATYDAATQEFVVHSPTLTATKWWPGDLGRSATHALVQAQLICSGAHQGMHAFIVPIRSLEDHSPLPGITVGDIGPKMDFDHSDNGFLQLDHVRVPRENMLSRFAQLHALSAGMKALVSDFCIQGAELCRRACGGHGYSKLSGLPSLVTRVTASCTYEGENTVLYLQTARFLVKSYLKAQESTSQTSLPQSVAYLTAPDLAKCPAQNAADFLHPELYTTAWAHVAARLIKDSVHHLQTLMQSGADRYEAWNQTTVIHLQAAKAHLYYVTVKIFTEALEKLENQPAIQQVLKRLCDLYALHGIMTNTGDFLHDGFLSGAQIDMVRKAYLDLLLLIRKDAILLTDAFDFTDQCLNSALGCYDGNVYERLFQWAQKSPTNTQGNPAYEKYIRPLLQGWRSRL
ncbi:peroxisomal acyl-coenzyme A oxidase 2 isoform X2 [Kogia breviceps]|uniref:peroxisomal acyl-coenzyme A oxidase 2 isoform X2 n=1 Tax=Kogia breviceps TaxID=27615 RepID=UPI0034D2797B